jgi:glycyl-tRNA synthetase beta chain
MEVPEEVLILTMKKDQKYFVTRDPKTGKLAPYFMTVSNIDARNNGKLIIGGNERVLSARLSDAKFFWDQDLKGNLENNLPKLNDIVFHEKLGTVKQRVDRIEALSGYIAELLEWDVNQAKRAAKLCKADLVSNMVNEFPEVQGAIGRYYALKAGEDAEVADAIRDHYAPKGPDDACPSAPVSVAVALAEKIDSLVGFFGADMKPTGSKDPFALRRAALGVIRLIVENEKKFGMLEVLLKSQLLYNKVGELNFNENSIHDLRDFIKERYKVQMRNLGISHDIIDAVYELDSKINLVRLQNIAKALSSFVATDDGVNLLAGYKRAANILRIEEKKDSTSYAVTVDVDALSQDEEKALHAALKVAQKEAAKALNLEDFEGAMSALSKLRAPTDAFFDKVTVNDGNATVRANRLALLSTIRSSIDTVADFSQIEG